MSKRKWSFTKANEEDFSEYRKALTEIINSYKSTGKEYDVIIQDHESSDGVKKFDNKRDARYN